VRPLIRGADTQIEKPALRCAAFPLGSIAMSGDLSDLYQQVILDHNKRPRNRGKLPTANRVAHGDNPTCGDQCSVYLRVDGDRIADVSFDGSGCAISQASASLMTTQVKGKTAAEVESMFQDFHKIVTTGEAPDEISDLAAFAGVHTFPARIKCATLGWHAALNALHGDPTPTTTESHTD
jgi:nitrogen fixation protein NifU and related proteins